MAQAARADKANSNVDHEPVALIEKNQRERLKVNLSEFNGHRLISVRIFVLTEDGMVATKSGFAFKPDLADAIIEALQKAKAQALELGWL